MSNLRLTAAQLPPFMWSCGSDSQLPYILMEWSDAEVIELSSQVSNNRGAD